jgi:hypothetical protein
LWVLRSNMWGWAPPPPAVAPIGGWHDR